MTANQSNQRGVVSMMACIIISILLIITVVSLAGLMVQEQRQATAADQSIRAYYAAESGAEVSLLQIKNDLASNSPSNHTNCITPQQIDPSNPNVAYTCQRITTTTNVLSGNLAREHSAQVDLTGLPVASMEISWNIQGKDASNLSAPAGFTSGDTWQYPAVLEFGFVSYPTGLFTPGTINNSETIVGPGNSGASSSITSPGPFTGNCVAAAAGEYNCTETLVGFTPGLNYVLRFRPRYASTNYQIKFFDASSHLIAVPDQYATIDVTAKSGDVYRRVIEKVLIRSGVLDGLDYALYSDTDICKDYSASQSLPTVVPGACPSPF